MKIIYCVLPFLLFSCGQSKETKRERFFQQGNYALANKQFDEAVDFYTKSIENDPDYPSAYNNRGVARIEDGHPYEAIQDYNEAIAIKPDYYEAMFNRAYAYESVGKLKSALEDIALLQTIFPDSAYIYFYKGILQTNDRQYDDGIKSFQKSISLDTTNNESYVNLATLYFFKDQIDSAKFWIRHVLAKSPNEPNAYNTMSQIYLKEADYQNSLIAINQALKIVPQEPYFLNNRGQVYLAMGENEKALKDINRSILLDPKNAWAYRNKGVYYLQLGEYELAIKLLNDAIKRTDFIDEVYSYLGEAHFALNQKSEACNWWKRGAELKEKRAAELLAFKCK